MSRYRLFAHRQTARIIVAQSAEVGDGRKLFVTRSGGALAVARYAGMRLEHGSHKAQLSGTVQHDGATELGTMRDAASAGRREGRGSFNVRIVAAEVLQL